MSHQVSNQHRCSIQVEIALKKIPYEYDPFQSTIRDLHQWIYERNKIPFKEQELHLFYPSSRKFVELEAQSDRFLSDCLEGVAYISLILKVQKAERHAQLISSRF